MTCADAMPRPIVRVDRHGAHGLRAACRRLCGARNCGGCVGGGCVDGGLPVHECDAPCLDEGFESIDHCAHGIVLEVEQALAIGLLCVRAETETFAATGLPYCVGGVQQCLRGNASAVQACAAGMCISFDERHMQAELRGAQGA